VGYNIYYGTASRVYTNKVSVGSATTATISGLTEGLTYFFSATTYAAQNMESDFSDEIAYTVPATVLNDPPTITGFQATSTAMAGQTVTFSVTATGTGPLAYQWKNRAGAIAGATNAVLTLTNVTAAQSDIYYVTVSNSASSADSTPANLTVYATTSATLSPAARVDGQFALNISGVPDYRYVVEASTNLMNWTPVQTNTAPFVFVDSDASRFSQRYYRTYCLPADNFADITNGLVVYYPLATNGNDVWAGNNLTLAGSPFFNSGAVDWNGAAQSVGYSSPQQWPQSGLTVSTWINLDDPTGNYAVATCYGNASGSVSAAYFQFFTLSGGLTARIIQNTDADYIGRKTSAALTSGWHFVAFTWTGETTSDGLKIYLDGVQIDNANDSAGAFSKAYSGSDVPLGLGAQLSTGYGFGGYFHGGQHGVRMYDHALSGREISTLYINGVSGQIF
jgi:hypothetical protein